MEPLSPEENHDLIALLVTMAVDSGYLPLHGAEKRLIEVREALIDTPAGERPIQVFEPTDRAFSAAVMLRRTSNPEPLVRLGKGIGEGTARRNFEALIPRSKRKWVVSKKYLDSSDPKEFRAQVFTIVRQWWPAAIK
ncbi:MAG: hypothetical protein ACK5LJ_04880 [Paracoccus sp. (in: a-proteobacteria)]